MQRCRHGIEQMRLAQLALYFILNIGHILDSAAQDLTRLSAGGSLKWGRWQRGYV